MKWKSNKETPHGVWVTEGHLKNPTSKQKKAVENLIKDKKAKKGEVIEAVR